MECTYCDVTSCDLLWRHFNEVELWAPRNDVMLKFYDKSVFNSTQNFVLKQNDNLKTLI